MSKSICLLSLALLAVCLQGAAALRSVEDYYEESAGLPSQEEHEVYFAQWFKRFRAHGIEATPERKESFKRRVEDIIRHNQQPSRSYKRTINRFTGRLPEELPGFVTMTPQNCTLSTDKIKPSTGVAGTPDYFNWRDLHMVTEIKNQGNCAAGYAFAASAAVESHWGIRTGSPPVLSSEQQFMDCSDGYQAAGCEGGLPNHGFDYLEGVTGLSTENTYPYEAQPGTCRFNIQNVIARVFNGSVNIVPGDEEAIFQAITKFGPITVGLDVTEDFFSYDGGIFESTTCKNDSLIINHSVLFIGYGVDNNSGAEYWLVKNSWGTSWGEEGYMRIKRGVNMCSLANCALLTLILIIMNPISNSSLWANSMIVMNIIFFSF